MSLLALIAEAVSSGASRRAACGALGISLRTVQRWQKDRGGDDRRRGPDTLPSHALSEAEKDAAVALANQPEYRNLSPEKVVAKAADDDVYICSESSLRRILKARKLDKNRGRAKPSSGSRKPRPLSASEPLRVLSWDITFLKDATTRGNHFYLYLYVDVWSRRILGWRVHDEQTSQKAAELLRDICREHAIQADTAVLHQDNGAPMKGATFLAALDALGIRKSFSRPRVSDDNAFIESLFRHLKYVPQFPARGFPSLSAAREWVACFVAWYNSEHLHSAIGYVTPDDRHHGADVAILQNRRELYQRAKARNPKRWSGPTRAWARPTIVTLNPERLVEVRPASKATAA